MKKDKWVCEECGNVAGRRLFKWRVATRHCPHCQKITRQKPGV